MSAPPSGLAHVKGQLLIARFDYLRETHDTNVVAQVLDSLAAADRDQVLGLARGRWYPFALLMRLDHTLAHVLAGDDLAFFEELGRASARHRTEWLGEHAALVNVHAFLSRMAEEHRSFHDFGRAVYRRTGFHSSDMTFSEYPELDQAFCLSSRGYLMGVLELLTGRPGEVNEKACQCAGDSACVFHLDWRRANEQEE